MTVYHRAIRGQGCSFCANKRVSITNSLATLFPELAKQWHREKNGQVKPEAVVAGSHKKVWWTCNRGPDHVWEARIEERTGRDKTGCPSCAGKKVSVTNSLATVEPGLAKQWHPTKNGEVIPRQVIAQSNKRYWWNCRKGPDHEWPATPNGRVTNTRRTKLDKTGCPFCDGKRVSVTNSLASLFPDVARQWHPTKNGWLTPEKVAAKSGKRGWWKCPNGPDHVPAIPCFSLAPQPDSAPFTLRVGAQGDEQ